MNEWEMIFIAHWHTIEFYSRSREMGSTELVRLSTDREDEKIGFQFVFSRFSTLGFPSAADCSFQFCRCVIINKYHFISNDARIMRKHTHSELCKSASDYYFQWLICICTQLVAQTIRSIRHAVICLHISEWTWTLQSIDDARPALVPSGRYDKSHEKKNGESKRKDTLAVILRHQQSSADTSEYLATNTPTFIAS